MSSSASVIESRHFVVCSCLRAVARVASSCVSNRSTRFFELWTSATSSDARFNCCFAYPKCPLAVWCSPSLLASTPDSMCSSTASISDSRSEAARRLSTSSLASVSFSASSEHRSRSASVEQSAFSCAVSMRSSADSNRAFAPVRSVCEVSSSRTVSASSRRSSASSKGILTSSVRRRSVIRVWRADRESRLPSTYEAKSDLSDGDSSVINLSR